MADEKPKCGHFRVLNGACDDCGARIELTPEERQYFEKRHLTPKQLAEILPMSEKDIIDYARRGVIPHVESEGRMFFVPETIATWVQTLPLRPEERESAKANRG